MEGDRFCLKCSAKVEMNLLDFMPSEKMEEQENTALVPFLNHDETVVPDDLLSTSLDELFPPLEKQMRGRIHGSTNSHSMRPKVKEPKSDTFMQILCWLPLVMLFSSAAIFILLGSGIAVSPFVNWTGNPLEIASDALAYRVHGGDNLLNVASFIAFGYVSAVRIVNEWSYVSLALTATAVAAALFIIPNKRPFLKWSSVVIGSLFLAVCLVWAFAGSQIPN